jgi:23S rRNA pseudouridine1911/1915/1917 synthase
MKFLPREIPVLRNFSRNITPWLGFRYRQACRIIWDHLISDRANQQAFLVSIHQHQERLDTYLRRFWPTRSRGEIADLIRKRRIKVNFMTVAHDHRVRKGDFITMPRGILPDIRVLPRPMTPPVSILYEDSWMLIADKPVGLVVHQNFDLAAPSLIAEFLARKEILLPPYVDVMSNVIHRIDKYVSGAVLVGRSYLEAESLRKLFREREIYKEYRAVLRGRMEQESGTIELPIRKDERVFPSRMVVEPNYFREARTDYQVLEMNQRYSLCRIVIHTGRTHQIRVHLAAIGHPILGDNKYGPGVTGGEASRKENLAESSITARIMLHAHKLEFDHPFTGRKMTVEAPVPAVFQELLRGDSEEIPVPQAENEPSVNASGQMDCAGHGITVEKA